MRAVFEFDGHLFATRQEAQAALDRTPKDWGSAVGWRGAIRERKVFGTAQEWAGYTGRTLR